MRRPPWPGIVGESPGPVKPNRWPGLDALAFNAYNGGMSDALRHPRLLERPFWTTMTTI